jgi:CcmD family protein
VPLKNYAFLFWAYLVIWLGLAAFLLGTLLRMRRVAERLDRVERELARPERDS